MLSCVLSACIHRFSVNFSPFFCLSEVHVFMCLDVFKAKIKNKTSRIISSEHETNVHDIMCTQK